MGHVSFRLGPELRFSFQAARSLFRVRLFSRRFYKHVPVLSRGFELESSSPFKRSTKVSGKPNPGPFSRARRWFHFKTQNRCATDAESAAPRLSFATIDRSLFSGISRRPSPCSDWPSAHSDRGIFHDRHGQPPPARRSRGQSCHPFDHYRPRRIAPRIEPPLPSRGLSHSAPKIRRSGIESSGCRFFAGTRRLGGADVDGPPSHPIHLAGCRPDRSLRGTPRSPAGKKGSRRSVDRRTGRLPRAAPLSTDRTTRLPRPLQRPPQQSSGNLCRIRLGNACFPGYIISLSGRKTS